MNDFTHPVLFQKYPGLEKGIAWTGLGEFPTPVEPLKNTGKGNLWIKRDDLSSQLYGGNKVRKLEFILAHALEKGKRTVVTLGGTGTNHGLATAIFARELGLKSRLILFRQPVTSMVKKNLLLFHRYGAELIYRRTLFRAALSFMFFERIRSCGSYFIFAGGSTPPGTLGFVNAAFELKQQIMDGELPEPEIIYCPLGSGGTLAGLTLGAALAGLGSKVVGVRVTASHLGLIQTCTVKTVSGLMQRTLSLMKRYCPELALEKVPAPLIIGDYLGDGYGCPTRECLYAMKTMMDMEGIELEPTYTAKTFACVMERCQASEGPVLYWHTYNSNDLSAEAASVDPGELPGELQVFLKEETAV